MYLLPRPQEMILQDNVFYVDYTAEICIDPEASPEWLHYASLLQKEIEQDTGFHLNINRNLPVFQTPSILLKSTSGHSQQEYTLRIRESGILLTASSNSGMLYAIRPSGRSSGRKEPVSPVWISTISLLFRTVDFTMMSPEAVFPPFPILKKWQTRCPFTK